MSATFEIQQNSPMDRRKRKGYSYPDISKLTTLSDCFILVSGSSTASTVYC